MRWTVTFPGMDELLRALNAGAVRYLAVADQAMRLAGMPRFSMGSDSFSGVRLFDPIAGFRRGAARPARAIPATWFRRGVLLGRLWGWSASAATLYVWEGGSGDAANAYDTWLGAARTIQDAVDAAQAGDLVLVTNGVYATGGRAVVGTMTNRVAVDRPVTLQSVNGPELTVIQGYQVPGTTNGDGATRCVYLADSAVLSGFTLTHGGTRISGDPSAEQNGGGVWCASTNAVLTNCILTANSAGSGGAAYFGTLNDCILSNNFASWAGGGAYGATLNTCLVAGNSAAEPFGTGGGASSGTLNKCVLTGNSAYSNGGGAFSSTLNNCTITDNSAKGSGGGASWCTLDNCMVTGNSASWAGGGASGGTLNNCTLTANSAALGGGVGDGTANNCILYYNKASYGGPNYYLSSGGLRYCCTSPFPLSGEGNLAAEPQLASASHLSSSSPCRGAGAAAYATGVDMDGETWLNPPSIGCDEFHAGAVTGAVTVTVETAWTNVSVGFGLDLTGRIDGQVSASVWDFGDGTVVLATIS